jgi:NitT/TauT family transport system substrate-binding protein
MHRHLAECCSAEGAIMIALLRRILSGISVLALGLFLAISPTEAQEAKVIRIVKQPGLGYLGLIVMRAQGLLEKHLPGVGIEWNELTSGPAIRDAMLAGQLDIGSGGLAPFILAVDRGLGWKIIGTLNDMPLYLNTYKPEIKSLKDFTTNDKIALPAPGSIQHITLQMAAEKELGNPKALDNIIVAMAHPEARAALISKREITAHLTSPPFQYQELKAGGIHKVLDSYQVVGGPHTFNIVWTAEKWAKANPKLVKGFYNALVESLDFINKSPLAAAKVFVESERSKDTPETTLGYMQEPGVRFVIHPTGLMRYAEFMHKTGLIKKLPASWKEYAFEYLHSFPGN